VGERKERTQTHDEPFPCAVSCKTPAGVGDALARHEHPREAVCDDFACMSRTVDRTDGSKQQHDTLETRDHSKSKPELQKAASIRNGKTAKIDARRERRRRALHSSGRPRTQRGRGNVSTQEKYPCQRIGVSGPVIHSASTSAQAGEPIRRHNSPPGSVRCVSAAFGRRGCDDMEAKGTAAEGRIERARGTAR